MSELWQKRLVRLGSLAGALVALIALWAAIGLDPPPWAASKRLELVEANITGQGLLIFKIMRDDAREDRDRAQRELELNPASDSARRLRDQAQDELDRANARLREYDKVAE